MRISDWSSDVCSSDLTLGGQRDNGTAQSTDRSPPSMSDMTIIREDDLIETVADALQYISYYHPLDYITQLGEAYKAATGPTAKDPPAQLLPTSRPCAAGPPSPEKHRDGRRGVMTSRMRG